MRILENKNHFIHEKVRLEHFANKNYFDLMKSFEIPTIQKGMESEDNSMIDWNMIPNHYQFFYNYEGSEEIISAWLKKSKLTTKNYLLTYFCSADEVIKVNIDDFVRNWNSLNFAVGFQGIVYISDDGELIMEFTDDYRHELNSNFLIKV